MKNIITEIIEEKDYNTLINMAKKYNMNVEDFGKLISKKVERDIRHQIRFSPDEIEIVDSRAAKLDMTRSEYCRRCYMKVIDEKLYMNLDIKELKKDTYKSKVTRDIRVAISFDDAEQYKIMRKLAKDFSLQFSTLIRYFALTVSL